MANPSIGGIEFIRIMGMPTGMGTRIVTSDRPNVTGASFHPVGSKAEPFNLFALTNVVVADPANPVEADAKILAIEALQGTIISVVTDTKRTVPTLMCLGATVVTDQNVLASVGGAEEGGKYMLGAQFTMMQTEV